MKCVLCMVWHTPHTRSQCSLFEGHPLSHRFFSLLLALQEPVGDVTVKLFSVVVRQPFVDNLAISGDHEQHGSERDRRLCSSRVPRGRFLVNHRTPDCWHS